MITTSARFAQSNSTTHGKAKLSRVTARAFSAHARMDDATGIVYMVLERGGADSMLKLRMLPADARELSAQLTTQADRVDPPQSMSPKGLYFNLPEETQVACGRIMRQHMPMWAAVDQLRTVLNDELTADGSRDVATWLASR